MSKNKLIFAMLLFTVALSQASAAGLVGEYRFDGNAQDSSGNGNNGTISGATFVQGISGQALSFDGVDDMVVVPHSSSLSLEKYTMEAWIKRDQNRESGIHNIILTKRYEPSWMNNYGLDIDPNGKVLANSYSPDIWTWFGVESVRNISAGEWYHLAATYDRATFKIYINGVLDNSVNTQYTPYQNNQQLVIGRGCVGDPCMFRPYSPSFNGIIDEVRIYNRALNASEIQANYNALAATPTTPAPTVAVTTVPPTPTATPVPTITPTTPPPTITPAPTPAATAKFRVGPTVNLRPVTDVIEADEDGIVELYMDNPSLNDVTLKVEARVNVPSGIHVYGQGFALAAAAGTAYGTFEIPPGTARTIAVVIKADKSARLGSHMLQFTGLYWPGDNKDIYQPISLTYPLKVREASKKPETADPSNPEKIPKGAETPTAGFSTALAILGIFAVLRLLSRD